MPSPAFTEEGIKQLYDEKARLASLYENLIIGFVSRTYKTERGREYAMQGLLRRLSVMMRCIELAFQSVPPEEAELPSDSARYDAEIAIQSFVFNVSGSIDNLAWVWTFETGLKTKKGKELLRGTVGLRRKHVLVRNSLSNKMRSLLDKREQWLNHIDDYRDALAHRIPLYIPPHAVTYANADAYRLLSIKITEATSGGNVEERRRLESEQHKLTFFRPVIAHSYNESIGQPVFHPQMISDFMTVEELAQTLLKDLP